MGVQIHSCPLLRSFSSQEANCNGYGLPVKLQQSNGFYQLSYVFVTEHREEFPIYSKQCMENLTSDMKVDDKNLNLL